MSMTLCQVPRGLELVVVISVLYLGWGWLVDTSGGANFGLELLLAEALVAVEGVGQEPMGCAVCWGALGQPVLTVI